MISLLHTFQILSIMANIVSSFVLLFFFFCCLLIQCINGQHNRKYFLIPYYSSCPGVPEKEMNSKLKIYIGMMFDEPIAGYNRTQYEMESNYSIKGEFLFNYSSLALAAYDYAQTINNNTDILPYHHLCLYYTFMPKVFKEVARGINYIYVTSQVHFAINALTRKPQHEASGKLMPYFMSLISIANKWTNANFSCLNGSEKLPQLFLGQNISVSQERQCRRKVGINMDMLPSQFSLYNATYIFLQRMNWKRFAIFTICNNCVGIWPRYNATAINVKEINLNKALNRVKLALYYPNDFLRSFSTIPTDYNIYIFLGPIYDFLRLLLQFSNSRTTHLRSFTWIYPYFNTSFENDLNYQMSMSFTLEEKEKIEKELRGSFAIFPIEDCIFSNQTHESYEGYLFDAMTYFTKLATWYLEEKSNLTMTNISNTTIEVVDKANLSKAALKFSIEGITRKVSFDRDCHRQSNFFNILNFVPLKENRVSKEIRGYVSMDFNNNTVYFRLPNGTLSKNNITLIFNDRSSNIPPDVIKRLFTRPHWVAGVTFVSSIIIYFTLAVGYLLLCIYRKDRVNLVHNETWLYKLKDVRLLSGDLKDTTLISLLKAAERTFEDAEYGKVDNKVAKIHKLEMVKTQLTLGVRTEVLQILELEHDNICPFLGGIQEGNLIKGIMYEFCSRGSLYKFIRNPDAIFNEQVRVLFAIDIANGLGYLHERKLPHGRLNLHNCVIDQLWKLKLTDYGLEAFHSIKDKKRWSLKCEKGVGFDYIQSKEGFTIKGKEATEFQYDIYRFGLILRDLSSRQSILDSKNSLDFDKDVSTKIQSLVECCEQGVSTILEIKAILEKAVTKYGLLHNATGLAEMNSRQSENYLEFSKNMLSYEKQSRDEIMSKYIPGRVVDAFRREDNAPLAKTECIAVMGISLTNLGKDYDLNEITTIIKTVDVILHSITTLAKFDRIYSSGTVWMYACIIEEASTLLYFIKSAAQIITTIEECQFYMSHCMAIHYDHLTCGNVNVDALSHVALGKLIPTVSKLLHITLENTITVSEYVQRSLPPSYPTAYLNYIIEEDDSTLPCHTLYAVPDVSTSKVSVSVLTDCGTETSLKSHSIPYMEGDENTRKRNMSSAGERRSPLFW